LPTSSRLVPAKIKLRNHNIGPKLAEREALHSRILSEERERLDREKAAAVSGLEEKCHGIELECSGLREQLLQVHIVERLFVRG
jgi:hypothetical protein